MPHKSGTLLLAMVLFSDHHAYHWILLVFDHVRRSVYNVSAINATRFHMLYAV